MLMVVFPVPVSSVEPELLDALRQANVGKIIGPLAVGDQMVVAELESFQPSQFDNELRRKILQQEFETWLEGECNRMLIKTSFPK